MADLVFIVSRAEPKQYLYLKHVFADESRDVVLDRRIGGERRRSLRLPPVERRHVSNVEQPLREFHCHVTVTAMGSGVVSLPEKYPPAASSTACSIDPCGTAALRRTTWVSVRMISTM